MALNKSKGNMYEFVTHTWNVIKGECYHDCEYCYMKRWGKLNPIRFDEKELKTDLGCGNFIFVGSSNDMFADGVPYQWISQVIEHCKKFDNRYLLQTKAPDAYQDFNLNEKFILGVTIETNRVYPQMGKTPSPAARAMAMSSLTNRKFITIEPIMDFDLNAMLELVDIVKPDWVNIGADTGNNSLPEPSEAKINELIESLSLHSTKIEIKKNMKRLRSL